MTTDNVRELPNRLQRLAGRIRATLAREAENREEWAQLIMDRATALLEAREEHQNDDVAFGAWLEAEGIDIEKNNRSGLLLMARWPKEAKDELLTTHRRAPRYIAEDMALRFPYIGKQERGPGREIKLEVKHAPPPEVRRMEVDVDRVEPEPPADILDPAEPPADILDPVEPPPVEPPPVRKTRVGQSRSAKHRAKKAADAGREPHKSGRPKPNLKVVKGSRSGLAEPEPEPDVFQLHLMKQLAFRAKVIRLAGMPQPVSEGTVRDVMGFSTAHLADLCFGLDGVVTRRIRPKGIPETFEVLIKPEVRMLDQIIALVQKVLQDFQNLRAENNNRRKDRILNEYVVNVQEQTVQLDWIERQLEQILRIMRGEDTLPAGS